MTTPNQSTTGLEQALNNACAALQTSRNDHSDEDIARAVNTVGTVVHKILAKPPQTLGDVRNQAKALRRWFNGNYELDELDDLLRR